MLAPLAHVSRHTLEEEKGGGGATTQTGSMQQGAAQRFLGKFGGSHGGGNCASPIRGARGCSVFILRVSFCCCVFGCNSTKQLTRRSGCWRWGVPPMFRFKPSSGNCIELHRRPPPRRFFAEKFDEEDEEYEPSRVASPAFQSHPTIKGTETLC